MTYQASALTRKELFLRACRCEPVPRLPVWMMRQAGRYLPEYREIRAKHSFLEVCKTPDLAVEVSLQPLRRLEVDAVIIFSDILIPAEAMGLPLELGDAGPNLPQPVRSEADVRSLRTFDPEIETGFLMEALRRTVRQVGPDVPVLGFAASPWTLACYMVEGHAKEGFPTVKSFLYSKPRLFRALLKRIAESTILYLKGAANWTCTTIPNSYYPPFRKSSRASGPRFPSSITPRLPIICCRPSFAPAHAFSAWTGACRSANCVPWRDLTWRCRAISTRLFSLPRRRKSARPRWT